MSTYTPNQQLVIARVAECFDIVTKEYPYLWGDLPAIGFGIKSKTAGLAYPALNKVSFNNTLLNENVDHFIKHVVAHEVAHIIDGILYDTFRHRFCRATGKRLNVNAHGKTWKHIMHILGVDANRLHHYDTSNVGRKVKKHNYECIECKHIIQFSTKRHNSILKTGVSYQHKFCQANLYYVGTAN